jgi:Ca2+-binding EF-hand superfamily protein
MGKGGPPSDAGGSPGKPKKTSAAPPIIKPPKAKGSDIAASIPGGRPAPDKPANKSADLSGKPKKKKKKKGKDEKKSGATYRRKKKTMFDQLLGLFGMASGNVALTEPRALEAAQALDLQTSHLRKLKFSFDRVDIDGSGAIDADEYFGSIGERRSPFTDKLFSLIDLDGNGTIDFNEFVRVLATYCMFTKDEILRFCFECFDVDSSGTIDEKEFIELCKVVNNAAPAFPANFKRALQEFDVNEDGLIDYAEFLELDRRYPLVLFPAFRMQDRMQQMSLGEVCDAMLNDTCYMLCVCHVALSIDASCVITPCCCRR